MALKTIPFDAAEHLTNTEDQVALLSEALELGKPDYIAHVLGVIARARGMTHVAREAGVTREALYRALSAEGDPKLSTVIAVTKALGMHLAAAAAPVADPSVTIARRIVGHATKKAPAKKRAAPKRVATGKAAMRTVAKSAGAQPLPPKNSATKVRAAARTRVKKPRVRAESRAT
jgi:probable addiction module antidote protein